MKSDKNFICRLLSAIILLLTVDLDGLNAKGAKPTSSRPGQNKNKGPEPGYPSGKSTSRQRDEDELILDPGNRCNTSLHTMADFCSHCVQRPRGLSHEERLLRYLFRQYDPVARALVSHDRAVNVSIDFVLLRIHGLDERSQVLTTTGLVIAEWSDERLCWEREKFGNLSSIILRADKIWLPELAVMNGADELMPDFERIRVLLHSDGRLHWEPGGIFRTTCDIDIAFFPFDIQHCVVLIGAYSYYSTKMNITNNFHKIHTHDFRINGEWEVYDTSADWNITMLKNGSDDGYSHVIFTLHMKRRYKFYIMNIVLPCVMLSVLIMIGFCLPPDAGEKISLGISVLLAFTVFLLMIADTIPRTSLAIPLIVTYLMATMTLGTMSVCMTVLVLNIHHRGPRYKIPAWLNRLAFTYIARLICMHVNHKRRRRPNSGGRDSIRLLTSQKDEVWKRRTRPNSVMKPENIKLQSCNSYPPTIPRTSSMHMTSSQCPHSHVIGPNHSMMNGGRSLSRLTSMMTSSSTDFTAENAIDCHEFTNLQRNCVSTECFSMSMNNKHNEFTSKRNPAVFRKNSRSGSWNRRRRDSSSSADTLEQKGSSCEEWRNLAQVLDRFFFWLLFALMALSALVILLYPRYAAGEDSVFD